MRYNSLNLPIKTFLDGNAMDEVFDAVDNTVYDGSGTQTGAALQYAVDNLLTAAAGRRAGVPLIAVVMTDGASQDSVSSGAAALAATGAQVIAIGIGEYVASEVQEISSTAIFGATFDELEGVVLDQVIGLSCADVDECATDNGGCSDVCVNTGGSYYCSCSQEGMALDADLKTCVMASTLVNINECAILNGGCSHGCEDTVAGYNCTCPAGMYLGADGLNCFDVNECLESPCTQGCVNTPGSYFCECAPTHTLAEDGFTCAARPAGADCPAGYTPVGSSCMQINVNLLDYASAVSACAAAGGRLASASSAAAAYHIASVLDTASYWIGLDNLGGTGFTFSDGVAAINVTGAGNCGLVANGAVSAGDCTTTLASVCEITRAQGLVVFSRTWPTGAQGVLYFPTGATSATINFPSPVESVVSWFGTITNRASSRSVTISQNYIEATSSAGQAEFVFNYADAAFADYQCTVN